MTRPGLPRMLLRGAFRRCPWCGIRGAFFDGWFGKSSSCHGCGLQWRRGDVGFELGAAAIAAIIVMGPLVATLGIVAAITWPELAVVPMLLALGIGALVLPIVLYPSSYTIWQALDVVMRPVSETDFDPPPEVGSVSTGSNDAPDGRSGPVRSSGT